MEPPKLRGHQWLLFFPYLAISFSSQIFVSFLSEYIYSNEAGCEAVTPGCTGVSGGRIFFFPQPVKELPCSGTYPKVGVGDTCRR